MATTTKNSSAKFQSRAVTRLIEPGNYIECETCGQRVKFEARKKSQQVICNVYEDGKWIRVEHYHTDCYGEQGQPYGDAPEGKRVRREAAKAKA